MRQVHPQQSSEYRFLLTDTFSHSPLKHFHHYTPTDLQKQPMEFDFRYLWSSIVVTHIWSTLSLDTCCPKQFPHSCSFLTDWTTFGDQVGPWPLLWPSSVAVPIQSSTPSLGRPTSSVMVSPSWRGSSRAHHWSKAGPKRVGNRTLKV